MAKEKDPAGGEQKPGGYVAVNMVNLHGNYFEPGASLPKKLCTEDYVEPLLASGDIRAI